MANATVATPLELSLNTWSTDIITEFQAAATDGTTIMVVIDASKYKSDRLLILVQNTNSSTTVRDAWILKGNGVGQPAADLACLDIAAASATMFGVVVESSKYVQASGTYKGKILVKAEHAEIKVAVIALPSI